MVLKTISKIFLFVGFTATVVLLAALVTFTSAAIISRPSNHSHALEYIQSLNLKKIVVDVDAGVDDAMALLLALSKPQPGYPEVIAITCTHGNTNITNVVINVLKTLRVLDKKIPVYMGAYSSLIRTPSGDDYYGKDGLGDVPDPDPPSLSEAAEDIAALALVKLAEQHAGELGVLALGPLSNLALATRLDPNFGHNLKALVWLGGSVEGIGNIKPGIEFNAYMDPEANYIVFNTTQFPIILFSWETCIYHSYVSKEWRESVLGQINSNSMNFLNDIEAKTLGKSNIWSPCDAKAMAVLLDPTLITKVEKHNVYTVFQGEARGALLVDYKDGTHERQNVIIIKEMDAERFKDMCMNNLS